jgi:hypothetical protein
MAKVIDISITAIMVFGFGIIILTITSDTI